MSGPEPGTAEEHQSSQSSTSSIDVTTVEDPLDTQQKEPASVDDATHLKKRARMSKKSIPEYRWADGEERRFADSVKEYPQLYDKKHKEWLNVTAKEILWNRVGEQLVPPATGAQCRKHYENMRTRVGKILKKERKSGAGQPERSARDDEIIETWGFLTQHIVRGKTVPSEQFAAPESATVASSDDAGDEIRSEGSQSQASAIKGKDKEKRSRTSATTVTATLSHHRPPAVSPVALDTDH